MFSNRLPTIHPASLPRVPDGHTSTTEHQQNTQNTKVPNPVLSGDHQKQMVNILQTHKAYKAINPDTGQLADLKELLKCSDGDHWSSSNSDEIGRLAQGRHPKTQSGSNTMKFIKRAAIPPNRKPTYLRVVCDDRPQKAEKRRVRWTAGGDKVDYPFDCATKTADLSTVKTLINSVISTPKARFMTMDIKDFYLNTDLPRPEFIRIPVDIIPDDIYEQYNLSEYEEKWFCICSSRQNNLRPSPGRQTIKRCFNP